MVTFVPLAAPLSLVALIVLVQSSSWLSPQVCRGVTLAVLLVRPLRLQRYFTSCYVHSPLFGSEGLTESKVSFFFRPSL